MVIVTSFQEPESRILYQQQNTRAVLDKHDLGVGTIIVSERLGYVITIFGKFQFSEHFRTLCWKEQGTAGFSIEYPHISMHAITSDRNVYPTDCIFLMIDGHLALPNVPQPQQVDDEEDSDVDEDEQISELLFIPQDSNSIRLIYDALSECQVLNPDANDEIDDEDEYVYEDANEFNGSAEEIGSDLGAGGDSGTKDSASMLFSPIISCFLLFKL